MGGHQRPESASNPQDLFDWIDGIVDDVDQGIQVVADLIDDLDALNTTVGGHTTSLATHTTQIGYTNPGAAGDEGQVLKTVDGATVWSTLPDFDVRDYGAVGDGSTDDRAAFQLALDAIHANGGGTLLIPKGFTFKLGLRSGTYGSSFKVCCFVYGSNVTIEGGGTILHTEGYANGFSIFTGTPSVITPANVDSSGSWWLDHAYMFPADGGALYPTYEIDPVAQGDDTVTLATAADASNFAVGDVGHFRGGQLVATAGEAQPDSFLDEITAVNGGTGVLTLKHLAPKPLVQEYFPDSGRDEVTTTSSTAFLALFGAQNVTDTIQRNIRIRDVTFSVIQTTGVGYALSFGNVLDYEVTDCTFDTKNCAPQSGGPYRGAVFARNVARVEYTLQSDVFFASDRGCGDLTIADNRLTSYGGTYVGLLHIHEGTYNADIDRNKIRNRPTATNNHAIQVISRGYNIGMTGNDIEHESSATGLPIYVAGDVVGLRMGRNKTRGKSVSIGARESHIAGHEGGLSASLGQYGMTADKQYLTFAYDYTWAHEVEVVVGRIPAYSYVTDVDVLIAVPFNGTSPRLYVGDDDLGSALVNNAVMSGSAWTHPTIGRNDEKGWYQNASGAVNDMLDVIVWPQQGGSTAGLAVVTIGWIHCPVLAGI